MADFALCLGVLIAWFIVGAVVVAACRARLGCWWLKVTPISCLVWPLILMVALGPRQ